MWPFRRRSKPGRHELGAAVTAIPSQPLRSTYAAPVVDPVAAPPAAPPALLVVPAPPASAQVQASATGPSTSTPVPTGPPVEVAALPPLRVVASPPESSAPTYEAPGLKVELGFRDGSTAALAPGSDQAKALEEIAAVLTQRD